MATDGLERAARESRGKRVSKLLDDEVEADDEFWNQEAFKEDADDNEYEAEAEEADTFDSDFDEDEPEEEGIEDEDEPRAKKKRKLPPGRSVEREKKRREKKNTHSVIRETGYPVKVAADGEDSQSIARVPDLAQLSGPHHHDSGETVLDLDGERSVRKSTRTAVVIKQAEREAHQAALQALSKPVKKKKEEERKISQEEMLLEAAQTEIQNLQALEVMLAREEEVKRKAIIQKSLYAGPQIRFHSREGKNTLEFTKVSDFPSMFNSRPTHYAKRILCVITGQPARYRDPKSHLPYATKEAFRIIRERFNQGQNPGRKDPLGLLEESHQRKRTKVDRERLGSGGRTVVTKLKKVISTSTGDAHVMANVSHASTYLKATEPEVQNTPQFIEPEPTLETPVDLALSSVSITGKNIDSLQLPGKLMQNDFALLAMPEAFVEANEADFMLDDLEVSLPANLETSLSIPTSMSASPNLLTLDSGNDIAREELEQKSLGIRASNQNQSIFSMDMMQLSNLDGLGSSGKDIL